MTVTFRLHLSQEYSYTGMVCPPTLIGWTSCGVPCGPGLGRGAAERYCCGVGGGGLSESAGTQAHCQGCVTPSP
jgi:hypothetical protein